MDIRFTEQHDKLNKTEWSFYIKDNFEIVLDSYTLKTKETTRHGYKIVKQWGRLSRSYEKTVDRPELTFDIKKKVMVHLLDKMVFKKEFSL